MRFITYGNADLPPVMMIHGMATTAEICYGRIARRLSDRYHVILAVLDGHDDKSDSIFVSVDDTCEKIERYVRKNFGGHLYAISGFSLGGSIAVELLQRGNISIEKAHLDAAFCIKLGALAPVYTFIFTEGMLVRTKISIITTVTVLMGIGFFIMAVKGVWIPCIILAVVWVAHIIYFIFGVKTIKAQEER